jgi:hypothetical protein
MFRRRPMSVLVAIALLAILTPAPTVAEPVQDKIPVARAHRGVGLRYRRIEAPLFCRLGPGNVRQGKLNDCNLAGSMAAVAHARPDHIRQMVVPASPLGWLRVAFGGKAARQDRRRRLADNEVMVTPDVPFSHLNKPGYARDYEGRSSWPAVLEKAYAKKFGEGKGYEALNHGGPIALVFDRLVGGNSKVEEFFRDAHGDDRYQKQIFEEIAEAAEAQKPMAVLAPRAGDQYAAGRNVVPWHVYAVLGASSTQAGIQQVDLYNPHANPTKTRGRFFSMPIHEFLASFVELVIAQPE